MTRGLGVAGAALYTPVPRYVQPVIVVIGAPLEQVLPERRIRAVRGRRLGQRLACPRSCCAGLSSCCSYSPCSPPAAAGVVTTAAATTAASPSWARAATT